jgi:hypothetical protein
MKRFVGWVDAAKPTRRNIRSPMVGFAVSTHPTFWHLALAFLITSAARADDKNNWIDLFATPKFEAFKPVKSDWYYTSEVKVDPKDPKKLAGVKAESGPIVVNGNGRTTNLVTKEKFGDCELVFDFMMPKGSNSGVKFHGHYEVQLYDSFGKTQPLYGGDSGGIYPRSEPKPKYHHIDKGIAPKINACKPPGEWQRMEITFIAPRFDADGKRTQKARITVKLNDKIVQDNLELEWPTGHAWKNKEMKTGPLLIQADHGPIAFKNFKIRHLPPASGESSPR